MRKSFIILASPWIIATIIISVFFNINILIYATIENFPRYLSIGLLLAAAHIILLGDKSIWARLYKVGSIVALLSLGGRGPIFFLGVAYLMYFALKRKFKLLIVSTLVIVPMTIGLIAVLPLEGRLARITKIGDSSNQKRIELINESIGIIEANPLGAGLGAFGQAVLQSDIKLYPHNIFLELFSETGIIGGLLGMIFIALTFMSCFYTEKQNSQQN